MQRKSHRLSQVILIASAVSAVWLLAGCSAGPCDDYDRVRGMVIKGRGAEPTDRSASSDSLALTPTNQDNAASQ